jgi:hypothetical protein
MPLDLIEYNGSLRPCEIYSYSLQDNKKKVSGVLGA